MTTTTTERAGLAAHATARALLEECWRLTPARMAEHLTNGRFQRFNHLRFLERRIAQSIGRGGARLLITMPPRHGKSWLASLFTPAWFLSLWPERHVVLTSSDGEQAAAWGRGVRDFLKNHQAELSVRLGPNALGANGWSTARGGGLVTAGVGGALGGRGGDLLIVDDPIRSWKDATSAKLRGRQLDWFERTLLPRAEPGASIIVIMTRWHEHDLAGSLERERPGTWDVLRIPAIAEANDPVGRAPGAPLCQERFGRAELERIRQAVGTRAWSALYQQNPEQDESAVIRSEWLQTYERIPERFDEVIQVWDPAFKGGETSDYVVGQVWGRRGRDKYLIDQLRAKMSFPETLEAVLALARKYPETTRTLIEDRANGSALVASLSASVNGLIAITPEGGKEARVRAVVGEIESGRVHLPAQGLAHWVEELIAECAEFPHGSHDDQVDAMAYALNAFGKEIPYARTQCTGRADLPDSEPARGGAPGPDGSRAPRAAERA